MSAPRPRRTSTGSSTDSSTASSTGLDTHLASTLCYLLGFVSGVVFLVIEKEDREVRFHAYQSVGTFLSIFVISVAAGWIPLIGVLVATILSPVTLILWIVLMVKAFQGEHWRLPVIGDWAEEQVG